MDYNNILVGHIYKIKYPTEPRTYIDFFNSFRTSGVKYIKIISRSSIEKLGHGDVNGRVFRIEGLDESFNVIPILWNNRTDRPLKNIISEVIKHIIVEDVSMNPKILEEIRTSGRTRQLKPEIEHSYWGDAAKVLQNEVSPDVKKLIGARRSRASTRKRSRKHRSTRKHKY